MNNDCSSSPELGKDGKRRREGEGGDATADRLSNLPDFIIHHILSFLDTKSAVQTSVLSRVWQCAWKHVPVLNVRSDSFQQYSSFDRFVENVLSLRHPFSVRSMSYAVYEHEEEEGEDEEEKKFAQFVKVIKYALSHDTQQLAFTLSYVGEAEYGYRFSDLFGTNLNCSLKSLELGHVCIDSGLGSSGFQMLTTLELVLCLLASDQDGEFDPFSNFPCLKNLVMSHCRHLDIDMHGNERRLKICGPQLLSLELELVSSSNMEIFAPRLKFFRLEHDLESLNFSKLTLPSLDDAVIMINDEVEFMEGNEGSVRQGVVSLFQGLSNVTTLQLDSVTIEDLSSIFEFLEQQASPFTKLKTLMVKGDTVPYVLLNYFLKGSSSTETAIEFV
ncbi:unnamed protein product [Linum tenue]|uniref:F-box domain-containing protein n=1 Tax=Linum tenue TaxID=586396 RepID=A0AAV0JXK7_9ROSI|nr:unnamed protein product [Linum tenue]